MKKNSKRAFLNHSLIAAAVALALGTAAYGQDKITANIPFEFSANGAVHEAGTYDVVKNPSNLVLQLRNAANGQSVHLGIGVPEGGSPSAEARPRLVFQCREDGGCALAQVWIADGRGYSYAVPKAKGPELESRLVVVYAGELAQ